MRAIALLLVALVSVAGTYSPTGQAKPCGFILVGDSRCNSTAGDWPVVLADEGYPVTTACQSGARISETYQGGGVISTQRQVFRQTGVCDLSVSIFGGASEAVCWEDLEANGHLRSCLWAVVDNGANDASSAANWAVRRIDFQLWMRNFIDEANLRGINLAILNTLPTQNATNNPQIETMGEDIQIAVDNASGTDPLIISLWHRWEDERARVGDTEFFATYMSDGVHPDAIGDQISGRQILDAILAEHTRRYGVAGGVNGGTYR